MRLSKLFTTIHHVQCFTTKLMKRLDRVPTTIIDERYNRYDSELFEEPNQDEYNRLIEVREFWQRRLDWGKAELDTFNSQFDLDWPKVNRTRKAYEWNHSLCVRKLAEIDGQITSMIRTGSN